MVNYMSISSVKRCLSIAVMLISAGVFVGVNANELDDKIIALSQSEAATKEGKALYEQMCASCHSKDLSGASGFNLKDGEWIHGSEPSAILNNVKQGFAKAGMPSFTNVYSEGQLQAIVAYILSKREGFEGLTYKLYQMADNKDKVINDSKLIKQGVIGSNFADFQLPEIQDYVIEFEGDFYTLKDEDTQVWIEWGKPIDVTFEVNGKEVSRKGEWVPTWKLARGKQHLKITYRSGTNKPNQRNLPLIVTNHDMSIKLFPISTRARGIMQEKKVEVKALSHTVVQRKKVMHVPTYSISVGLPAKINYAFNTRSCAIVGLWQGDMLNVGPNVGGRGQDGSLPLGDWMFHSPESFQHSSPSQSKCKYKGYKLENNEPVFSYKLAGVDYKMTASATSDQQINFHYQVQPLSQARVVFNVPKGDKLNWQVSHGDVENNRIEVMPNQQGKFTISAQIN